MSLTPEQAQIIKACVPILAEHGLAITTRFYENMLGSNPELNHVFSSTHQKTGHQPRALAKSLHAYASYIDDLGALSPAVELICHKHASLYIQPEQYNIVGTHLLAAMKEVLGDALTPEIHDAWAAAYWQLAGIMIAKEASLYARAATWTSWRDFRIARKVPESSEIMSFYLEPVDGQPLPSFLPGQYISIQAHVPGLEFKQARQYSLSDAPNNAYYRISVKREDGAGVHNPGHVSTILHDQRHEGDVLSVSHPFGDFFFDADKTPADAPVVFLSAGVGLTCLMAILNTLTANKSARPITFIHVARTKAALAFAEHVKALTQQHENVRRIQFISQPDMEEKDFDVQGRLDLAKLDAEKDLHAGNQNAQYFVCGPEKFMVDIQKGLRGLGVNEQRVHLELFGTGGVPRPADEAEHGSSS